VSAASYDWQVATLAIITTIGVVVCAAVSLSTGRARWALAAGFASLLAAGYWANILGHAGPEQTLITVRGIGIGWLAFALIVLPLLSWRDSVRGRKRAQVTVEQIIQAGALEDQK
jgi:hypothetical protein